MTFNEYETLAGPTNQNTLIGGDPLPYLVLGLCGEAGELADKLKKVYRDNEGVYSVERLFEMEKEVGDCLWYLSQISEVLGFSFDSVAMNNIQKLWDRELRGMINGDGDNR